jgi:subfamily B ATP-binding cassette protein MsbA
MRLLTPINRRLIGYLRPYLFPYVAVMLFAMLLLSASEGAIVIIIKRFTNNLTVSRDVGALPFLSLLLLGIFLVRAVASFGADYLDAYIIQKTTLDMRGQLNEALQNQSL